MRNLKVLSSICFGAFALTWVSPASRQSGAEWLTNHHTPLFETPPISKAGEKHGWDGFATWQDKDGTAWVFASISAAISLNDNVTKVNSSNMHGGIRG